MFFVYRCYVQALKLMSEVPSLWYDLGLNYYQQSRLLCPLEGDQSSTPLLLEKAQEVRRNLTYRFCFVGSHFFKRVFFALLVFKKGHYVGEWKP